ncbi:MAG: M48 family metallopeptidase, partial [Candidatus Nanopelagicales bacterium]
TACLVIGLWLTIPRSTSVGSGAEFSADPAVDFSSAEIEAGDRLSNRLQLAGFSGLAVGLALAVVLGFWPFGARIVESVARPLGGAWWVQVLLGGLVILLIVRMCTLPFAAWSESVRRDVGLSTRDWSGWAIDVAKGFGVNSLLTLTTLLALVALARRLPNWWWVGASVGAALLVVVVSFAYPLVVEPLFNKFTPMADGALRTSLLDLAKEDGVAVDDVLVADASRRTSSLNAYVSGFGSTRRVVVYDTLLHQASDAEIRSVVAHELGHAKQNDVVTGTLLAALGAAAAVVALYLLMTWQAFPQHAGVTGVADGRVVAVLLALIAVTTLLTAPIQNWASRQIEARADTHALDLTRDPTTFTKMQRRLALAAKSDLTPNPIVFAWFGSHPTTAQRMAAARNWAAGHDVPVPPPLAPVVSTDSAGG